MKIIEEKLVYVIFYLYLCRKLIIMKNPKYKIGDKVYHVTPDSDAGVVVNIIHYYLTDHVIYEVVTSYGNEHHCYEEEISYDKTFT